MAKGSKDSQINVRFDEATDAQLVAAAKKLGTTKSALVRHLTETFLSEIEATGSMALDLNWKAKLNGADARSPWGEPRMIAAETKENSPAADLPRKAVIYPAPIKKPKTP
jgi:predicted DNA-binding protein